MINQYINFNCQILVIYDILVKLNNQRLDVIMYQVVLTFPSHF